MKIREAVLVLTALPAFAQQAPPKPPTAPAQRAIPSTPVQHMEPGTVPNVPTQQFTEAEQALAADISQKQAKLQAEINDFLRIVRMDHPGYEFSNGNLVQVPPPPKPPEKK